MPSVGYMYERHTDTNKQIPNTHSILLLSALRRRIHSHSPAPLLPRLLVNRWSQKLKLVHTVLHVKGAAATPVLTPSSLSHQLGRAPTPALCPHVMLSGDYRPNPYLMDSAHALLPSRCLPLIRPPRRYDPDVTTGSRKEVKVSALDESKQTQTFFLFFFLVRVERIDSLPGRLVQSQLQRSYYLLCV